MEQIPLDEVTTAQQAQDLAIDWSHWSELQRIGYDDLRVVKRARV